MSRLQFAVLILVLVALAAGMRLTDGPTVINVTNPQPLPPCGEYYTRPCS